MGITDERIDKILNGRDVNALLGLIDDLQVPEDEQPRVVLSALSQLEALSYEELPELTIRICVEAPKETAREARHWFLDPWLKREGYHHRPEMIENVTAKLRNAEGGQLVAAIRTAWVLGYRDDLLQAELARIAGLQGEAHPDNDAQGYALAALSDMAYPDLEEISKALQARLERNGHLTKADCWTAMHAATQEMIPALCEVANSDSWGTVSVQALLRLPSRYPETAMEVWKVFESLDQDARLMYAGVATDWIDLEEVGHYLVSEVLTAFQHLEQRNVLPPTGQLLQANLPSHIRAFSKVRNSLSPEQREWLKSPAVNPTGNTGHFNTRESFNKESAWGVILRLGLLEARKWLPAAMVDEINFTLVELGDIAGFLGVAEAAKPLASVAKDEAVEGGVGIRALRCLGVIGTPEALNGILESQVRLRRGEERFIPMDLVEALVSACMAMRSCRPVWDVLCNPDADRQIREACAHALKGLSTLIEGPMPSVTELIGLLRNAGSTLPGYEQLVSCLSRFGEDMEVLRFLRDLANSDYESRGLTQALALTGLLNDFPACIEKIGIKRTDEGWIASKSLDDTATFALLSLYRADQSFEPALLQVLEGGSFSPTIQIIANLRSTDHLSPNARQALWNYVLRGNGPNSSNQYSLKAVARTWPEKLLENSTIEDVSRWGTSARRAYLRALRVVLVEHQSGSAVARLASQFLVDDDRDVRRDAARLTRDSDPSVLQEAIGRFTARAEELDQAVFMLDSAFWLETEWHLCEGRGRSHREPLVRYIARTLSQERKQAALARDYLTIVLNSDDYLETWCYGQALLDLGNEETVDNFYAGLPSEVYRRNYRIWLAKELEKRLERKRKDQSEKIILPPTRIDEESIEALLELNGERVGPFAAVLQYNQSRRARRLSAWSIRIDNEPELALRLSETDADESIYIETTDGRSGRVLPIRTDTTERRDQAARVILLGEGQLKRL